MLRATLTIAAFALVLPACGKDDDKKPSRDGTDAPVPAPAPETPPDDGSPPPSDGGGGGGDATPLVIGALGDSITTAFDAVDFLVESPEVSWSTGDAVAAAKGSHYARFKAELGIAAIEAHNAAVTGARAADLAEQLDALEAKKPRYVTILIGANDVCGWPSDHAAALADYKAAVDDAVTRLVQAEPAVKVLLVGTPDLYRLYTLKKDVAQCRQLWDLAGGCRALLSSTSTDAERQAFRAHWVDMNAAMAAVAAAHAESAKYAVGVAEHAFGAEDVSSLDCFHPSAAGQKMISDYSWDADFARAALPPKGE